MYQPVSFILNDEEVHSSISPSVTLLDFIRYEKNLKGTKIGCREGDCGACNVLLGEIDEQDNLKYKTITSCLTPLGNIISKHVITVEGINPQDKKLSLVQQAMSDNGGTQCGFCTPGFIVSLTEFAINSDLSFESGIESINGNICRCTGYKPIERAINNISKSLIEIVNENNERNQLLVDKNVIPKYYLGIKERLKALNKENPLHYLVKDYDIAYIGGGTDLFVQKHDDLQNKQMIYLWNHKYKRNRIFIEDNYCVLESGCTFTDISNSYLFLEYFPKIKSYMKLIASTPVRNLATIAGNIINASPIGDMTIFFLSLDSDLIIRGNKSERVVSLKDFYLDYKKLDLNPDEYLNSMKFPVPKTNSIFNFEKVSKRTNLDIASVNSAISITNTGKNIESIGISAGGLAPIPKYLDKTVDFLTGKELNPSNILEAQTIAQSELSPISDIRGSKEYKRLLFRQLFFTHFITLFEEKFKLEDLI
ncbi:MAG: Glyceraldehyde dehydrogenase small chain [Candidatus Heimdallarchaeota archaeon LC_3]|nr:MAG: Glyceraldehyde dehydrogenase small chain [Candidatus Heimdallarchaeota archaeon LC_3]